MAKLSLVQRFLLILCFKVKGKQTFNANKVTLNLNIKGRLSSISISSNINNNMKAFAIVLLSCLAVASAQVPYQVSDYRVNLRVKYVSTAKIYGFIL